MFQEVSPRLTLVDNSLNEHIIVAEPRFTMEHPVPRFSCLDLSPACPHAARSYQQAEEVRAGCKVGRAKRKDAARHRECDEDRLHRRAAAGFRPPSVAEWSKDLRGSLLLRGQGEAVHAWGRVRDGPRPGPRRSAPDPGPGGDGKRSPAREGRGSQAA